MSYFWVISLSSPGAPRLDDCHSFQPHLLCSSTDKQFLLVCLSVTKRVRELYSPARVGARLRARVHPHTHTYTHIHTHAPRSRGSMGIDRVGKGALITGPRVREKTAENRSLQLFRAAEQNRLPPVSTARARAYWRCIQARQTASLSAFHITLLRFQQDTRARNQNTNSLSFFFCPGLYH